MSEQPRLTAGVVAEDNSFAPQNRTRDQPETSEHHMTTISTVGLQHLMTFSASAHRGKERRLTLKLRRSVLCLC